MCISTADKLSNEVPVSIFGARRITDSLRNGALVGGQETGLFALFSQIPVWAALPTSINHPIHAARLDLSKSNPGVERHATGSQEQLHHQSAACLHTSRHLL